MLYVTISLCLIAIACMIKNKETEIYTVYIVYSYFNIKYGFTIGMH